MYCKYCGKYIENDSIYCTYCGKNITTNENIHTNKEINTQSNTNTTVIVTPPKRRNKKQYLNWIQHLDIENQADQVEEITAVWKTLTILFVGLAAGLYYWFIGELIFSYEQIKPFWGFVIYILITLILTWISSLIGNAYWKEYNKIIIRAREEIDLIIKEGNGSEEDIERMKTHKIERILNNIVNKKLTIEEYEWHTSRYCWGCGKRHTSTPVTFSYQKTRNVSWKEGAVRYSKTFRRFATIKVCPECRKRFRPQTAHSDYIGETKWNFNKIPQIASFLNQSVDSLIHNT